MEYPEKQKKIEKVVLTRSEAPREIRKNREICVLEAEKKLRNKKK